MHCFGNCQILITNQFHCNDQVTKARPTLEAPLSLHARSKACRSRRLLSSSCRAPARRFAAAPAPGPSWESRSSRHMALARTAVTLMDRLISPTTLPSWPSLASHPWALDKAAILDSANVSRSWCNWGERSPHGPTTSCPSSSPPRPRNLATKGPGGGSGSPWTRGCAPWNLTS